MSLSGVQNNPTTNSTQTKLTNPQDPNVKNGTSFINEQLKTALKSVAEGMTNNHVNFEKAHSVSLGHNTSNQGFWDKIKQVLRNIIHSLRSLSRNPDQAIRTLQEQSDRAINTLQEQSNAIQNLYLSIYDQCIRNPDDTMTFNRFNELFKLNQTRDVDGIRKEIRSAANDIRTACKNLQEEAKHFTAATKERINQEVKQLLHNLDRLLSFRTKCEAFSSTANDFAKASEYHGLNEHKDDPQFFKDVFLNDLKNHLAKEILQPQKGTRQVS
ncbi:MAG TPA: hypothetical protein DEW74_00910 [Opitutae bacterium]|nr:hypothetical protein [Opitutae bacterium]